ncbi:undecaprenyl-diphosphate phosphatase [Rivularia sp. UHCC 0363]|uniref:undecaprenyl-diphosphate phosphatase n=1 Tax=Rivularia sp. UHCC 0363 TaxID=3110244 RepID=UPI002B200EBE|nr:undecaprenyl-diphosphate phosphatase [Rivularia sp. UHCC 0363]MEA5595517.1 undecaprenyl-diphosphate phosphatase [Rivularia sp. UHCC 0363]
MAVSKRWLFPLLMVGSSVLSVATFPLKVLSQDATTPVIDGAQMNVWQGIVLGFVQGATEFLPISSTAHLKVVPVALGWGDPGVAFSAVIQLGSIAAVIWYFWGDLTRVLTGAWIAIARKDYQNTDFRIAVGIAIGTLPILFLGVLVKYGFKEFYDNSVRSLTVIAIVSIIMAVLLGLAEIKGTRGRNFEKLRMTDGILMGCAQALALVPGASRSGSTLTAGLFMGLERETAARFSFLLGIPAITLSGLVELKGLLEVGAGSSGMPTLIAGVISSTIFSYLAIAWLVKFLKTRSTWIFVWYRLIFGIAILAGLSFGVLQNV